MRNHSYGKTTASKCSLAERKRASPLHQRPPFSKRPRKGTHPEAGHFQPPYAVIRRFKNTRLKYFFDICLSAWHPPRLGLSETPSLHVARCAPDYRLILYLLYSVTFPTTIYVSYRDWLTRLPLRTNSGLCIPPFFFPQLQPREPRRHSRQSL